METGADKFNTANEGRGTSGRNLPALSGKNGIWGFEVQLQKGICI